MPLLFNNAYALKPQQIVGPTGQRYLAPLVEFVAGTIPVFNDYIVPYPPGTVIIAGINLPTWRAGKIAQGVEAPPTYLPCDPCGDSINYASGWVFMGVAIASIEAAQWGLVATAGSVVPVRCNDSTVDTGLQTRGTWVRWSANFDDNPDGLLGCVEAITTATLVSSTANTSRPGSVVGQIVVPAGTAANATGSIYTCVVRITPR